VHASEQQVGLLDPEGGEYRVAVDADEAARDVVGPDLGEVGRWHGELAELLQGARLAESWMNANRSLLAPASLNSTR
jgi:hypothetical protein